MPPKKAAKKTAKKAAKEVAGKHHHHKVGKDARRTFEHLGRIQAVSSLTQSEAESLRVLTVIADAAFQEGKYKESADLLRSAEHLSFAALHVGSVESVPPELREVIEEEVEDLVERSKHHESHRDIPKHLKQLAKRMRDEAKIALKSHAFRAALEFARGAEALGHIDGLDSKILSARTSQKQLEP